MNNRNKETALRKHGFFSDLLEKRTWTEVATPNFIPILVWNWSTVRTEAALPSNHSEPCISSGMALATRKALTSSLVQSSSFFSGELGACAGDFFLLVVASFISVVVGCTFPAGSVLGSLMGPMRGERKHEIKSGHHSSFSETASLFFYSLSMGKLRSCPPFLTSD